MFRKIDIYRVFRHSNGRRRAVSYLGSTNRYRTCRDAVASMRIVHPEIIGDVIAYFDKGA